MREDGFLDRPVLAHTLVNNPSWQLRLPEEVVLQTESYDEGQGHGYDNMDTSARVSRECEAPEGFTDVTSWYRRELIRLGWQAQGPATFTRGPSEHFFLNSVEHTIEQMRRSASPLMYRLRTWGRRPVSGATRCRYTVTYTVR